MDLRRNNLLLTKHSMKRNLPKLLLLFAGLLVGICTAQAKMADHWTPNNGDSYAQGQKVIIPSVIMTVVAFICAFGVYLPFGSVNLPFVEGPGNERQKKLGVLLSRIIGIMILGITLFIAIYSLAMKDHSSILPVVIIVGSLIGVSLVFTIMMYRAK